VGDDAGWIADSGSGVDVRLAGWSASGGRCCRTSAVVLSTLPGSLASALTRTNRALRLGCGRQREGCT
jgi:hypothetical protein